jgi:molecular chaperone Hsp33
MEKPAATSSVSAPSSLLATPPDLLIRALHRGLNVRIVAAITTQLCQEAAQRHRSSPAASCALGRGLSASLLLATLTRGGERVTIQLQSSGPLRGFTVDAYDDGLVRGYPLEPQGAPTASMAGRQQLCKLIGRDGVVNVMRDVGLKERYQGQVNLVTAEVDEDVEAYLRQSEQIPSALGTELVMDAAGNVLRAGAVLVQSMPDSPPEVLTQIREAQHALRSGGLYDCLNLDETTPLQLAQLVMGVYGDGVEVLDSRPLAFRCRCDRGRIEAMIAGMSLPDLDGLIDEGKAEITCNFCSEVYLISRDELVQMRALAKQREQN